MIKAAFFDIDGTLVSFRTHDVPASAVEALERMHQKGIKLFIATGRAHHSLPRQITELDRRLGFDGFLTFNGQYCLDAAGEVYRDAPLNAQAVETIVEQGRAGLYPIQLMQRTRTFVNRHTDRVRAAEANVDSSCPEMSLDKAFDEPTYQICAYVDPGEEHIFMDKCSGIAHTRWCDYFCDIIPAGGGKPVGIAATLERFGLTPQECCAFGDGGNDVPMFGCVGTSVAMGNASDAVKASATYVTDDIDEDGLLHACEHLGLV